MMRFYDKLQKKYKPKVKVKIRYLYIHNTTDYGYLFYFLIGEDAFMNNKEQSLI